MDIATSSDRDTNPQQLDSGPPRPPRSKQSLMAMGSGGNDSAGIDTSSPAVQAMMAMGEARNALLKLSSMLPSLAQGVQQIISGLEAVVPQQVADLVAGNPPGSSGSGMGAPQANAAPTAPPVQTGMA